MMLRAKGKNQILVIAFYKFLSWLMTGMLFLFKTNLLSKLNNLKIKFPCNDKDA